MQTSDFDYVLPQELIAQYPASPRDSSRLLVLDRKTGQTAHYIFNELPELLQPGDVLVFNDSRVLPARLWARKRETGARLETLLLKDLGSGKFEVLLAPAKRVKVGTKLHYRKWLCKLQAEVLEDRKEGIFVVQFSVSGAALWRKLARIGEAPLPPYINGRGNQRGAQDLASLRAWLYRINFTPLSRIKKRYQTIYARVLGSAAAPTAGLHFTTQLLERLKKRGVGLEFVTLHVGLGTFLPVRTEELGSHKMHSEFFTLSREVAERLNRAKQAGRRIIAVGTTSVRVLETCTNEKGLLEPQSTETAIFIYPGYQWKFVDQLITNFHLPQSTLLMLVSAFAGRELVLSTYEEAKREKYRFYSFGDAMYIK